jgi:hypothetical protein
LSELLDEVAGKPVQVEVSAVRVLFELLGLLLEQLSAFSYQLSALSYIKITFTSAFCFSVASRG